MVGFAMRAKAAYIYVRGEFWHEANCVQQAVNEVIHNRFRPTQKVSLVKMPAAQATTSTSMFIQAQEHTSAEKRLV